MVQKDKEIFEYHVSGEIVSSCEVVWYEGRKQCEIVSVKTSKEHRNRNYATALLNDTINTLFDKNKDLKEIDITVEVDNIASNRVCEKLSGHLTNKYVWKR